MKPGTKVLRAGRCSLENQIYHLTSVTKNRQPLLTNLYLARSLINALHTQQDVLTLAYVVMPDHFHWLMQLQSRDADISRVMQSVKTRAAKHACNHLGSGSIWQKGFYDHALRKEEDIVTVARYIVANPLRAGIVSSVREYPHWDAVWL